MTTEEKAKAYDEALERAKEKYPTCYAPSLLEYIFPVLKESKDEKNTLEVKEVDLEKEFDKCCKDYIFDDEWEVYIARHFFKLGFQKAQKGE